MRRGLVAGPSPDAGERIAVGLKNRTGGEDGQSLPEDPAWVRVVPRDAADALSAGIREMLTKALNLRGERNLLGKVRALLTWAAYGGRYAQELDRAVRDVAAYPEPTM